MNVAQQKECFALLNEASLNEEKKVFFLSLCSESHTPSLLLSNLSKIFCHTEVPGYSLISMALFRYVDNKVYRL